MERGRGKSGGLWYTALRRLGRPPQNGGQVVSASKPVGHQSKDPKVFSKKVEKPGEEEDWTKLQSSRKGTGNNRRPFL